MALASGTRLGVYEIVSAIGAGGMGEVYRATDTRLKRQVAVKVLPTSLAADPERLARFQREAEVLASLNHPHIAAIHGLEDADGVRAIVMELVDGEDLSVRIGQGPVPLDQALALARQIAGALEAAHEQGIVHRDLKPANIRVRPDGTVKVLDFGLAKMIEPAGGSPHDEPTVTSASLTRQGAFLGTVTYMSPEQINGQPASTRSDVWAFGCVVFEMLTGRAPFEGRTAGEILANVLKSEPNWQRLPADTPDPIRRLLRHSLAKDVGARWRDIGDAGIEIDDVRRGLTTVVSPHRPAGGRERLAWLAAVAVLAAAAGALALRPAPEARPAKLVVDLTTLPVVDPQDLASFALSPDGTQVVATGLADGRSQLVLRGLDSATSRPLTGTVGGVYPFWSPDGRSLGFFVDGYLLRLDFDAGLVRPLVKATVGVGGSWNADGAILFAPNPASPILRTSSDGGPLTAVTALAAGHAGHAFPHFLPDGRHFLYFVVGSPDVRGVHIGRLDGSATTRLFDADAPAVYTAGHLLFVRNGTLYAQPFDTAQLEVRGSASAVAEGVMGNTGYYVTVSAGAGTVAFRAGSGRRQRQFVRVDRTGREIERLGEPDDAQPVGPTPAPGGDRVAVFRRGATDSDVWLFDTRRGVLSRFTTTAGEDIFPAWSRDGSRIAFASNRTQQGVGIYSKPTAGGDSDTLLVAPSTEETFPSDWSPDGRTLVFQRRSGKTGWDLWAVPVGGGNPSPLIQTDADERNAQISPDGTWIAYTANTSGRDEVYVKSFAAGGTATQVSVNGGAQVRWRPDGRELFYIALDSGRLVAVPVRAGAEDGRIDLGAGTALFAMNVGHIFASGPNPEYVPSADGQRFLINTVLQDPRPTPLRLVLNWHPSEAGATARCRLIQIWRDNGHLADSLGGRTSSAAYRGVRGIGCRFMLTSTRAAVGRSTRRQGQHMNKAHKAQAFERRAQPRELAGHPTPMTRRRWLVRGASVAAVALPGVRALDARGDKAMSDTIQDNKALVGRWFTEFWGSPWNPGVIDELASLDMVLQYSLHAPRKGREDVRAFITGFRTAFPDLGFTGAADLIAEGDYVVGRWVGGGTHTGPAFSDFLAGALPAASGRRMHFTGTTVIKVVNGKIAEEVGLDDGVTALTQLGLMRRS